MKYGYIEKKVDPGEGYRLLGWDEEYQCNKIEVTIDGINWFVPLGWIDSPDKKITLCHYSYIFTETWVAARVPLESNKDTNKKIKVNLTYEELFKFFLDKNIPISLAMCRSGWKVCISNGDMMAYGGEDPNLALYIAFLMVTGYKFEVPENIPTPIWNEEEAFNRIIDEEQSSSGYINQNERDMLELGWNSGRSYEKRKHEEIN